MKMQEKIKAGGWVERRKESRERWEYGGCQEEENSKQCEERDPGEINMPI